MEQSKNVYSYPVEIGGEVKFSPIKSEAHTRKLEYAVDFSCPEGTPIRAARKGEVVFIKQESNVGGRDKRKYWLLGNRLVVKHTNKEYTAYEHFVYHGSRVKVGDKVKTGQIICYSGNTGYTFGPHLHFEVFKFTGPNKDEDYQTLKIKWKK